MSAIAPTAQADLNGSCHCGDVQLTLPAEPEVATRCNCSVCRRLGAVWVYFERGAVTIAGHPESTQAYAWGEENLRFVRCARCGCTTHWEALPPTPDSRCGVNLNLFPPALQARVRVRRRDGADSWAFLD